MSVPVQTVTVDAVTVDAVTVDALHHKACPVRLGDNPGCASACLLQTGTEHLCECGLTSSYGRRDRRVRHVLHTNECVYHMFL